jgi:hypothetical protein
MRWKIGRYLLIAPAPSRASLAPTGSQLSLSTVGAHEQREAAIGGAAVVKRLIQMLLEKQ